MHMGAPTAVTSYSMSDGGVIELLGADGERILPASTMVERSYERPKGPKVLSRVPLATHDPLASDSDRALLVFDTLFAIDANTREIDGCRVSVAVITLGTWVNRDQDPRLEYGVTQALEFHDADCHPDILALACFAREFESTPGIEAAGRVGIVMDSHLGILPQIQFGERPILDDYCLPDGLSIIFASDAASDRLPNVLIRASDRAATDLLRCMESKELRHPSETQPIDHATYFCVWNAA